MNRRIIRKTLFIIPCLLMACLFVLSLVSGTNPSPNVSAQSASTGSSAYTASISNNGEVSIDITPTSSQQVFTGADSITFNSTCAAGATVSIQTDSSSNKLTRVGADSLVKTIDATTHNNATLDNDSWGFSTDNGSTYNSVPVLGSETALYNSTKAETNKTINVLYGVKTDNNLPSGTYTNNVIYTVSVSPECLTYTLKFDLDGGTGATGVDYTDKTLAYGNTINLSSYGTPTKEGYTFAGWTNGSDSFTGSEISANVNPTNTKTITLKAKWQIKGIFGISNMQDMTADICASTTTPAKAATSFDWDGQYHGNTSYIPRVSLKDTRDNKYYLVSKLADGKCWMSQNLELTLSTTVTLTNTTTDLNSKTSWTPSHNTETTFAGTWNNTTARSYQPASGYSYVRAGTTMSSSPSGSGTTYDWEKNGFRYNWYATTAGAESSSSSEVNDSICPRGFKLPKQAEINNLFSVYGTTASTFTTSPIHLLKGGYIHRVSGWNYSGSYGYYWTSTGTPGSAVEYRSDMYVGTTPSADGMSVRCIAR